MRLTDNPFYCLGASTRDSRRRLMELADERQLTADSTAAAHASRLLTNPRARVHAELRWLPGLSPSRARAAAEAAATGMPTGPGSEMLPLAAINVAISQLVSNPADETAPGLVAARLASIAGLAERIKPPEVRARLNEDRAVAGFPDLDDEVLAAGLEAWHSDVRDACVQRMRQLGRDGHCDALSRLVEAVLGDGSIHGPTLVHEIVDATAVDFEDALDTAGARVEYELEVLRLMAGSRLSENEVVAQVRWLASALREWDAIAQPFQVSSRARGQEHSRSRTMADAVRDAALALHRGGGHTKASRAVTVLMQEVFAELVHVADMAARDAVQIDELLAARVERESDRREWEKAISFEATYGVLIKTRVAVSAGGVRHEGQLIPLEDINRVRWGATRHSVNGIPTGTTYMVFVGSAKDEIRFTVRNENLYNGFVTALYRATVGRLSVAFATELRAGGTLRWPGVQVSDTGIVLAAFRLFRANEQRFFPWAKVRTHSANGYFVLTAVAESGFEARVSYQDADNTHLLSYMIAAMRESGVARLSEAVLGPEAAGSP